MRMIVAIGAAIALAGCGTSKEDLQDQIDEAESQNSSLADDAVAATATLEEAQSSLADAKSQLAVVQGAISDLESEHQRFSYDNWQDVVPDIQDGIETASASASELESKLDEVESALEN